MKRNPWLSRMLLVTLWAGCGPTSTPETSEVVAPAVDPAPVFPCRVWRSLDAGTAASFRGLSAVSEDVVWVSGTGGTWGRSLDGGETWVTGTVPGAEELDFRDVDAFDARAAYLMSAGPGDLSRIYKTTDGGETWDLQHANPSPEGFYDGMAFWDVERGLTYGDPVDGRFVVLTTVDGGETWSRVPAESMPPALPGEAGFAASGSGLAVVRGGHAWFGTGGPEARVFRTTDSGETWTVAATPMLAGEASTGIFSLAFSDPEHGVAVGGDYRQPEAATGNAILTRDGGLSWIPAASPPTGYRSGVAYAPGTEGRVLVAVGTSGSDYSLDGGETWSLLGQDDHNAVRFGGSGCAAWAAGPEGRFAKLDDEAGTAMAGT